MFLKKLFGTSSQRYIKKLMPIVDQINDRFKALESKSDQDLVNRTIRGEEEKPKPLPFKTNNYLTEKYSSHL